MDFCPTHMIDKNSSKKHDSYFLGGRKLYHLCFRLLTTSSNHTYGGAQVDNQALMTGVETKEGYDHDKLGKEPPEIEDKMTLPHH